MRQERSGAAILRSHSTPQSLQRVRNTYRATLNYTSCLVIHVGIG